MLLSRARELTFANWNWQWMIIINQMVNVEGAKGDYFDCG